LWLVGNCDIALKFGWRYFLKPSWRMGVGAPDIVTGGFYGRLCDCKISGFNNVLFLFLYLYICFQDVSCVVYLLELLTEWITQLELPES